MFGPVGHPTCKFRFCTGIHPHTRVHCVAPYILIFVRDLKRLFVSPMCHESTAVQQRYIIYFRYSYNMTSSILLPCFDSTLLLLYCILYNYSNTVEESQVR